MSNNFAEHQTLYLNISMEQQSAGGHDVIECEDCRETITWCSRCVKESSLRLAVDPPVQIR